MRLRCPIGRVCGLACLCRTVFKVADFEFSKRGAKKFARSRQNKECNNPPEGLLRRIC